MGFWLGCGSRSPSGGSAPCYECIFEGVFSPQSTYCISNELRVLLTGPRDAFPCCKRPLSSHFPFYSAKKKKNQIKSKKSLSILLSLTCGMNWVCFPKPSACRVHFGRFNAKNLLSVDGCLRSLTSITKFGLSLFVGFK